MEIMDSDNDVVVQMKRDYNSLLKTKINRASNKIDFGESYLEDEYEENNQSITTAISMEQLLKKEKEQKQKEVEMIRQKTYISQLENKVNALETCHKRARVEVDKETEMIRQNAQQDREKLQQMRHQFNVLGMKEQEARQSIVELQQEMTAAKQKLNQKIQTLQKSKLQTETAAEELEMELRQKISTQKRDLLRQQTEIQISKADLQEVKDQLATVMKKYSDVKSQLKEAEVKGMESEDSHITIRTLEQKLESAEGDSILVQASKGKLAKYKELEIHNQKLKEENQYFREMQDNTALLREQMESVKRKLERSEHKNTDMAALQVRCEQLQHKMEKWSSADEHGTRRPMSPSHLTSRINELQNANAILLEKQGHLQTSVSSLEEQRTSSHRKLQALTEQLTKEQTRSAQLADFVKRAQRKIILVTKERDSYKNIIETYENKLSMNVDAPGVNTEAARLKQQETLLDNYRKQTADQEKELETKVELITTLKANIKVLQSEIGQLKESRGNSSGTTDADQQIILALREQVATVEKDMEKLAEEKMVLEDRIEKRQLQGEYDPSRTKVIHFTMNPLAEAQKNRAQEVANLKEENLKLRKRLQVIEEADGQFMDDLTVKVEKKMLEPSTSDEVNVIKKELEKAETTNKRLVEAFTKTSQEFREVCYQLLGYQLKLPCQNQYKLMSMYAESPEDFFLFKSTSDGMQMLGTPFSSQPHIVEKIETYLENGHSIPAFLSSITIDLFSRQTMMS